MSEYAYEFLDAEDAPVRRVRRSDGVVFELERHQHHANLHGHIAEQWLRDGSVSVTKPYVAPAPATAAPPKTKQPIIIDDQARQRRRAGE
jgi:hypothetical protein